MAQHHRYRPPGKFSIWIIHTFVITAAQDPVLFTGTIASNIAFGLKDVSREDIEAAAREANCEFILGMPKGFDTESSCLFAVCFYI